MIYVCHVTGKKLWNEPNDIQNILDDLEKYKNNIIGLEFSHNSIGEKCAEALGEKMKNLIHLRKVNLDDCFVSRGEKELPNSLKFLLDSIIDKQIKELNLSDNALGPMAENGYQNFFKNNKTLEKLYLNNCGMGPVGTPNLMKMLINNSEMPLKVLRIARNILEDVGCKAICELIKAKKNINELVISDNEIKEDGIGFLFNTIKNNKNIKILNIQNNNLSDEINTALDTLPTLTNIENLDLSDLSLDEKSEEIKKLLKILPNLPKLKVFSFEYNIDNLALNKKEKYNFITEFLDSLLELKTIKEIFLSNNNFTKDIYNKYSKLFKEKKIFCCFYSQEEKEEDIENNELDMKDLNKN